MSIAKGIAKAAKAQSRGLSGKRNSQGDFMPEDVQVKGIQDSVEPDIQKYIDDVKSQIDELDDAIEAQDRYLAPQDGETYTEMGPDDHAELTALIAEKEAVINDLITKLEENGIEVPQEVRDLKLYPYDREMKQRDDVMKEGELEKEAENLRIRKRQQSPDYEWTPGERMA